MKTGLKLGFCILFTIQAILLFGQSISGRVVNLNTNQPVPFANVYFKNTVIGTTADENGNFNLQNPTNSYKQLSASSIGFEENTQQISNQQSPITIYLKPQQTTINQITIKGNKKTDKDTAAIQLYRRIVKNKKLNSIASLNTYQFTEYEKTEFAISNVKHGLINNTILKRAAVIKDYLDTTFNGNIILPALLRERIQEIYFSNAPPRKKVILTAERFDGVQDYYKWQITEHLFEELDIYQNIIRIQNKGFISPFAENALPSYKYFIADTIFLKDERYVVLEFTPRRKGDLAFTGSAVIHDQTAAIKTIDIGLAPHANLNFVAGLNLNQQYQQFDNNWFKKTERLTIHLNLTNNQKHQNFRVVQTKNRSNIKLNTVIPPAAFKGQPYQIDNAAWHQNSSFWKESRPIQLTNREQRIANMLDTVKNTPVYKRSYWLAHAIRTGYLGAGPIEIGRWESLYSWNGIEGNRFKFGIKNNRFLFKQRYHFNTYIAYGDKDKLVKYHFWNEWNINRPDNPLWNALGAYYRFDWSYDYNYNRWWSYDRIFQSLTRIGNPLSNLFLIREGSVYFEQEVVDGVFGRVAAAHKTVYSWPDSYQFTAFMGGTPTEGNKAFRVVDFQIKGKLSLPSRIQDQRNTKSMINFDLPYLEFDYHFSPKGLMGSDFSYHLIKMAVNQKFNSPLGQSIVDVKGGKLFGTVPFPLLEIHQGNESIGFNKYGYNLMNDFEYASDTWGELWFEHHFDGLLFNLLPINRHLKIRSLISFKALTGSLTPSNKAFLFDAYQLQPIQNGYLEMGVGIENIARVVRFDFLWRMTQRNNPESRKFGIRWQFKPNF